MKKIIIICLLIGLFRVSYSQLPGKKYFEQSIKLINKHSPDDNYIKIIMENGTEYEGRFVAYHDNLIIYKSYSTEEELRISLDNIRRIKTKQNISAYDKISFENLYSSAESVNSDSLMVGTQKEFKTITIADTQEILENITEQSLNDRQTVALEKIAKAQTYFMVYSIVVTVLCILLLIV